MVNSTFPAWLVSELERRGWTQADLARAAGISTAAVSNLISANRNPGSDICRQIALALKLPQEVVFRAAGILEPQMEEDPRLAEINYLMQYLPEEDRDDIIEYVRMRARLREKREGHDPQKGLGTAR